MWIDTLGKLRFDCAWSSSYLAEIANAIRVLCRDGNFSALQTTAIDTFQRPALFDI